MEKANVKKAAVSAVIVLMTGCAVSVDTDAERAADRKGQAAAPLEAGPASEIAKKAARGAEPSQSCVVNLESNQTTCFASFRYALSFATGGRITDAPELPSEAMHDVALGDRIDALSRTDPMSDVVRPVISTHAENVWGMFFEDAGWGGQAWIFLKNGECTSPIDDVDKAVANVPTDMNDETSSFRCFANCWCKIFETHTFGGASLGFWGQATYVGGAMNDRTSSIIFS
jgi:hypothetical protein